MRQRSAEPLKIALSYALFGGLWILLSDRILLWMVRDPETLTRLQSFKGYAFVVITAVLLHALTRRSLARIRQAEAQAWQAQKMEALGRLAATVAHDMNNALGAMNGLAQVVQEELGPQHPQQANLDAISAAGSRGRDLVRQLTAFTRHQGAQTAVLALDESLRAQEPLLRRLVRPEVRLDLILPPACPSVLMDPVQLEQVLMNLVSNASDAIQGAGAVILSVAQEGRWALISVRDTGQGMDEATQRRIFEPFFTTKAEGTGLGLATVYGIVHQTGGRVSVHSRVGEGTTFDVRLPRLA